MGERDEFPGVRVVVEDEGEGIAPEMRRRVFTKFWTSGVRGGSGLGLYLVNGLVRAHGGTVVIGDAERRRRPDRADLAGRGPPSGQPTPDDGHVDASALVDVPCGTW